MKKPENVRYENQFYRPHRVNNNTGIYVLFVVTLVLVASTIILAVVTFSKKDDDLSAEKASSQTSSNAVVTNESGEIISSDPSDIIVATPTPLPEVTIEKNQNPVLYPATVKLDAQPAAPYKDYTPSARGASQDVYKGDEKLSG